jgi:hypothetical protein
MTPPAAIRDAWHRVGGLSSPSKMPGFSYGLPAAECQTGGKLAARRGTVCSGCYALKGNYAWRNVQAAQYRRLAALDSPTWIEDMTAVIGHFAARGAKWFRWHDSGDLQSPEHYAAIIAVCKALPHVRFWLPTREYRLIASGPPAPPNLCVRVSAAMIDGRPPNLGFATSTVHSSGNHPGKACRAYTRGGHCGNCRACWHAHVENVSYPKH